MNVARARRARQYGLHDELLVEHQQPGSWPLSERRCSQNAITSRAWAAWTGRRWRRSGARESSLCVVPESSALHHRTAWRCCPVEQWVGDAGEPGARATLEDDDARGPVDIKDRHAIGRTVRDVTRRGTCRPPKSEGPREVGHSRGPGVPNCRALGTGGRRPERGQPAPTDSPASGRLCHRPEVASGRNPFGVRARSRDSRGTAGRACSPHLRVDVADRLELRTQIARKTIHAVLVDLDEVAGGSRA